MPPHYLFSGVIVYKLDNNLAEIIFESISQKEQCIGLQYRLDPGISHFGFLVACRAGSSADALMSVSPTKFYMPF